MGQRMEQSAAHLHDCKRAEEERGERLFYTKNKNGDGTIARLLGNCGRVKSQEM
jgi:hypothetical protein